MMNVIYGLIGFFNVRIVNMKRKNCVGCRGECSSWARRHGQTCPCGICLIKMMCSEGCEVWKEWYYNAGREDVKYD